MPVTQKLQLEFRIAGEPPAEDEVFLFDVPGAISPRFVPIPSATGGQRTVEGVRTEITFEGARLVAADASTLWGATKIGALRALIETREPAWVVRLLRDTGGVAPNVLWTLSAPTYEQVRIEEVRGLPTDELMAAASWVRVAPFTLVVSALKKLPDADGIVGFKQEIDDSAGPSGLREIEYRTEITTSEGVDARALLKELGRVPIELLGTSWSYPTGNELDQLGGVNVVVLDADERGEGRVGTIVRGVSRAKQWGVEVGTTGPGTSPSTVSYSERTTVSDGKQRTEVRATAQGPWALEWVKSKRPSAGVFSVDDVFYEHSERLADGRWELRENDPTQPSGLTRTIEVEITGGHEAFDYEAVADGYEPVEFDGPLQPYQVTVKVRVERQGGTGANSELPFPELLTSIGLRLDYDASRETEPAAPPASSADARSWTREALLVYRSARKPTAPQIRAALEQSQGTVESYHLG